jgi:hypothetical protein
MMADTLQGRNGPQAGVSSEGHLFIAEHGAPIAFESLTIDNTVGGVPLTPSVYGDAIYAKLSVETASIRIRVDGGAPTSTLGHLLAIDDIVELANAYEIANFRAIRTDSTSATIMITYFESSG